MSSSDFGALAALRSSVRAVPAMRYALALPGLAAALAISRGFLPGVSVAAMLPIAVGCIITMATLLLFAISVKQKGNAPRIMANIFLGSVCFFVVTLMIFTIFAIAIGQPRIWAKIILPKEALEIPAIATIAPSRIPPLRSSSKQPSIKTANSGLQAGAPRGQPHVQDKSTNTAPRSELNVPNNSRNIRNDPNRSLSQRSTYSIFYGACNFLPDINVPYEEIISNWRLSSKKYIGVAINKKLFRLQDSEVESISSTISENLSIRGAPLNNIAVEKTGLWSQIYKGYEKDCISI